MNMVKIVNFVLFIFSHNKNKYMYTVFPLATLIG